MGPSPSKSTCQLSWWTDQGTNSTSNVIKYGDNIKLFSTATNSYVAADVQGKPFITGNPTNAVIFTIYNADNPTGTVGNEVQYKDSLYLTISGGNTCPYSVARRTNYIFTYEEGNYKPSKFYFNGGTGSVNYGIQTYLCMSNVDDTIYWSSAEYQWETYVENNNTKDTFIVHTVTDSGTDPDSGDDGGADPDSGDDGGADPDSGDDGGDVTDSTNYEYYIIGGAVVVAILLIITALVVSSKKKKSK